MVRQITGSGRRSLTVGLSLILLLATGRIVYASGASLSISPLAGTYEVGSTIDVSFLVDTGGEAINAVQADILFPADKLQVVNPVASTSFISIWVTAPSYSNTDGTIHFQGGLPNPGIKTSGGVISTVTFRVKSPGPATIKFAPTSQVLRNDGKGTNILTSSGTAQLTLKTPPPAGPVVTSPTHPDSNEWYSNSQVQLAWEPIDSALGYSYSFDQTAKSTPDEKVDTTQTSASVKATSDGVWYFHIRALTVSWGGTTSYPVQIDTTPPAGFTPKIDQSIVTTQDTTTLRFLTTDAASGLDHYEVRQVTLGGDGSGNTLFVETSSPYIINPLAAGKYAWQVRAFDRAGNATDGSVTLTVTAAGLSFFARVPLLRNPAVANAVVLGLGVLLLIALTILIVRRLRIRSTFQHDLATLEKDARKKSDQLQRELNELQRAQVLVQHNLDMTVPPTVTTPVSPTIPPPPPTMPPPPPAPSL